LVLRSFFEAEILNVPTEPGGGLDSAHRYGIAVSRYNREMSEDLLRGARERLASEGIGDEQLDVIWVPGAWELPLAIQRLAQMRRHTALIALGVVIRGQTSHDRHINRFVSLALGKLSLRFNLPIAFGVLTCNTLKQALRRSDPNSRNKGGEAAAAALEMVRVLGTLVPSPCSATSTKE
jgi:6,7-dimethyl-8-ribityllumazine synthase